MKTKSEQRKKEATKEKMLKLRIFLCDKTQMRDKATKFAIETEEKTFS